MKPFGLDSNLLMPPGLDSGLVGSPQAFWVLLGWFALVLVCPFGLSIHSVRRFGPEPGPSLWTLILVLVRPFGFSIRSVRQFGPGPSPWTLD